MMVLKTGLRKSFGPTETPGLGLVGAYIQATDGAVAVLGSAQFVPLIEYLH